ncbi:MAG: hypothetical protein KAT62_00600 [Desulfuromonadales bacterium]|nr:hypothetical protein [Desulfuromonadales bacterium]
MRHFLLLILLSIVFWICMANEWWLAAFISIGGMWSYFLWWMFSEIDRKKPDNA